MLAHAVDSPSADGFILHPGELSTKSVMGNLLLTWLALYGRD